MALPDPVTAALVGAAVGVVVSVLNNLIAAWLHGKTLAADEKALTKRFLYDRELAAWKRKVDLAEEVLAAFYKVEQVFKSARSPVSWGGEGETRPGREDDPEAIKRYRDSIYAPLERLDKERDTLTSLNALRFRFAANFGAEMDAPFLAIVKGYNEVQYSTHALLNDRRPISDARRDKYEQSIGWGVEEPDPIATSIRQAVLQIEEVCVPILQFEPSTA